MPTTGDPGDGWDFVIGDVAGCLINVVIGAFLLTRRRVVDDALKHWDMGYPLVMANLELS